MYKTVPDAVLEAYSCRVCDKYLTVPPISIHPDGGNVCGRCNPPATALFECSAPSEESCIPYAIFAYSNHRFPCINRFEGCVDLLRFSDINKHELSCRFRPIFCGFCIDYKAAGTQLITHFKKLHPFNFFDQNNFAFKLKHEQYFLVKIAGFLFTLRVDFVRKDTVCLCLQGSRYIKGNFQFVSVLKSASSNGRMIEQSNTMRKNIYAFFCEIKVQEDVQLDSLFCSCNLKRVFEIV